jgi:hypothetical protein
LGYGTKVRKKPKFLLRATKVVLTGTVYISMWAQMAFGVHAVFISYGGLSGEMEDA